MNKKSFEFERAMARVSGGESLVDVLAAYPSLEIEERRQLEAASWLARQSSSLDLRPGALSAGRVRLEQRLAADRPAAQRRWAGYRIQNLAQVGLAVIMFLMVIKVGQMTASAAQLTLPGETLYPIKLAIEEAYLALTADPQRELDLHIAFSHERLLEFEGLVFEGRYEQLDAAALRLHQTVAQTYAQARGTPAPVDQALYQSLSERAAVLSILAETVPPEARPVIEAVMVVAERP